MIIGEANDVKAVVQARVADLHFDFSRIHVRVKDSVSDWNCLDWILDPEFVVTVPSNVEEVTSHPVSHGCYRGLERIVQLSSVRQVLAKLAPNTNEA